MTMEREGGTGRSRAASASNAYSAVLNQQRRGCGGFHRGDLVCIKGEPGMHAYKVLAVDTSRSAAMICRVGDASEAWTMPLAALSRIQ